MLSPGDSLGPYRLEAPIGRGGAAEVWRARHPGTGAACALKVLLGSFDVESRLRFQRESQAIARVGGEAIVPVHEAGVDGGRPWIALGLCEGGSLHARLQKGTRWSLDETLAFALPLCRALGRCHAAGLVHRDHKPENILFDAEGRAFLADFGIARESGSSLTATGVVLGTPAYMAPEQLEGRPTGPPADVFSFAAILYELLAGAPPFPATASLPAQLEARRRGPPRLPDDVPAALRALVLRALAVEVARRPGDGKAFADELANAPFAAAKPTVARPLVGLALVASVLIGLGVIASERPVIEAVADDPALVARIPDLLTSRSVPRSPGE